MAITYQKECILQNAELAIKYGTCGHSVNLGCVLLAVVSEEAAYYERYEYFLKYECFRDGVPLTFPDKTSEQVEDQIVCKENEVYAYRISDKRVRVIISSDYELNCKLMHGLDLFPTPNGCVI